MLTTTEKPPTLLLITTGMPIGKVRSVTDELFVVVDDGTTIVVPSDDGGIWKVKLRGLPHASATTNGPEREAYVISRGDVGVKMFCRATESESGRMDVSLPTSAAAFHGT